jgi:hypothetical protein
MADGWAVGSDCTRSMQQRWRKAWSSKKKNYSYYTEMNDEALHYAMIGEHPKEKQQAIE